MAEDADVCAAFLDGDLETETGLKHLGLVGSLLFPCIKRYKTMLIDVLSVTGYFLSNKLILLNVNLTSC